MTDSIYDRLLDSICQGRLVSAMVNEAALALAYCVSRNPVREVVRRLQGIQLVPRLESMACCLATERMGDAEIEALLKEQSHARSVSDNTPVKVFDFHERIVQACGNSRIVHALRRVYPCCASTAATRSMRWSNAMQMPTTNTGRSGVPCRRTAPHSPNR